MICISEEINISTRGNCDILNITNKVEELLNKHKIQNGHCTLFSVGSTAGITTIEYEPGLLKDLPEFFEKIIPSNKSYHHDNTWHDGNGYAHLRSALLKTSLTIPIVNGNLTLGTWQQIVFIDFDNRRRNRKIIVQFLGI